MTYRQYTKCVEPDHFTGAPVPYAVAVGMFAGLMALVLGMLASGGFGLLLLLAAGGLALVTGLLSFCHWWLYGRLICLGGDQCAIGMVVSVEPPTLAEKPLPFDRLDSDYSFGILLPPLLPGAKLADVVATGIDGYLIAEQSATHTHYLPFKQDDNGVPAGYTSDSCDTEKCGHANCRETAVLHCEFEGAGMYIFYQWLKVLFALLIAAAVASTFCLIPVFGWVACLIAMLLLSAAAAGLLAGWIHALLDSASPSDVNPALGSDMHQNGCDGKGADLVVVFGTWVYDSLHEGWNEIHPIKQCQRIGTWNGAWPFNDPQSERDKWCGKIAAASSPLTVANQEQPENQWVIHPFIDGCRTEETDDDDQPVVK